MARLAAVTGATGFLGGYIVDALIATGWRVRILARRDAEHPQLAGRSFETVLGDLSNKPALDALIDRADAVVHAAGLIKARNRAAFHAVNVQGTANLVAALNAAPAPKRLIHVSSMAAREPHLSDYAATKRESEGMLSSLSHIGWTVVRPSAVYGPWDRETLTVFKSVVRGFFPMANSRRSRVALIHASDAAGAVASLCDATGSGQIFELTDRNVSGYRWDEIARAADEAVGRKSVKLPLPAPAVRTAAIISLFTARLAGRTPMLTPGKARELLHSDWGSSPERQPPPSLWQPRIDLGDGFRDTMTWYRAQGWLPR